MEREAMEARANAHGADDAPSFDALLRRSRKASGLTQEELAAKAGLTAKAISSLERGERKRPYPHTVRSLAEALEISGDGKTAFFASASGERKAVEKPRAFRGGVPASPTRIVGRERELSEVGSLLRGARLLTLTGTGGVGKTRLAVEAARGSGGHFSDGVAFVGMAPLASHGMVMPAACRAMGLRETEGQSAKDALASHLRGKNLLLVLDNFEHVLEAAVEVAELIEACDGLTVLATSRAPLRVRVEREYPVEPLALPATTRSPEAGEVLDSAAGRLFSERAKESLPSFDITVENAPAVASICWRLSGLPLALELAAAKVRFLDPESILARLDRALSAGWARDLPERQRTMRATLDWSHDLLGEEERTLFRRLSVFSGGFSLESAEVVGPGGGVGAEEVMDVLAALVEHSLVHVDHSPEKTRYSMLEPVREYAHEKLDEIGGESDEFSRRHAERYHALALEAGPLLMRDEQVFWLDRMWSEKYNLVAAMRYFLDGGDFERAVGLTWSLWRFWWVSGLLRESRGWMEEVLSEDEGELPAKRRAEANLTIGTMAWSEGEVSVALPSLERGLALSRTADDARSQAIGLMLLGLMDVAERDGGRAHERFEESLRLYRVADEGWGEALTLNYLGMRSFLEGDHEAAGRHFGEGLAAARVAGDGIAAHQALLNLGAIALERGDCDRAYGHLSEGLSLATEAHDILNAAYFVKALGQVAGLRGRSALAARLLGASETAFRATGSRPYRYVPDDELQEKVLTAARGGLGDETFEEEWRRGLAMTLEHAIAESLEG